jgi:hypothetical protein
MATNYFSEKGGVAMEALERWENEGGRLDQTQASS